jgi:hypothetical protein
VIYEAAPVTAIKFRSIKSCLQFTELTGARRYEMVMAKSKHVISFSFSNLHNWQRQVSGFNVFI